MKSLKKLSRVGMGRAAHHHIIYMNDETGVVLCSTDMGHSHQIFFQEPQPPQVDEFGVEIAPAIPGGWVITPGLDGHTHEIQEYVLKPSKRKEDDAQVLSDIRELFKAGRDIERESLEKAREAEKLYSGEHWDEAEKVRLEELSRACVTINKIERQIDQVTGVQKSERTDIKYTPQDQGDSRVADLLNITVKHLLNRCYFAREESATFEDAAITGRGLFNVYVKFDNDLRGEIIVEKFPYDSVVFGPHEKPDLSDLEYLIKTRWFSKAKIEQLWPEKVDDIQRDFEMLVTDRDSVQYAGDDYARARPGQFIGEDVTVNIARKEYLVIECWRKIYETASVIANAEEDFYFNAYGWEPKDIKAARTIPGFYLIENNITKMRVTKVAGGVVLSDEYPADLPVDDFFVIPVYGKKRGHKWWGKVHSSRDAQLFLNKNYSSALDVLNKCSLYGFYIDSSIFPDNEKEKFKRISSSPGFIIEVNDVSKRPVREEGVKFPAELIQMMQIGEQQILAQMDTVANPNGANESGALFAQRRAQKLLGSEFLFDNLSFAKVKLGRLLIKLIQRYYTPDRILRIVRNVSAKEPVQVGGEPIENYSDNDILELLQTTDLEYYDVEVTESAWSPSMRLATFQLLSEMAQSGQPVPPEALLQFVDLPTDIRSNLQNMMAQQSQAQAQAQQSTADAEIQKTLIGQGIIPPEVEQRFLQAPQQEQSQNETNRGPGIM